MQELVVESLVVSLAMVVFYVLVDETTQMPLAERDHACETLLFDRPDEPLGIGVEIGTLRRQPNRLNTGCFRHQLLVPSPYLVLTKPLRLDIQCQRAASVKIGWKYLDD